MKTKLILDLLLSNDYKMALKQLKHSVRRKKIGERPDRMFSRLENMFSTTHRIFLR